MQRSVQDLARARPSQAEEVVGPAEGRPGPQVPVDRPAHSAPLGHHQAHRVLLAAAAGREVDLAEAATPAVGPSDVEEW